MMMRMAESTETILLEFCWTGGKLEDQIRLVFMSLSAKSAFEPTTSKTPTPKPKKPLKIYFLTISKYCKMFPDNT